MVSKSDIVDNIPALSNLNTVADGDTVSANIENINNQTLMNKTILLYQFVRDDAVGLEDDQTFDGLITFDGGIKVGDIGPLTTNGNIILSLGTGAVYKNSATTANKYLTSTEIDAKIATAGDLTDGDKGDITVASSGTAWTIDSGAVTQSKMTWNFSTKTTTYTAVNNDYIFADTSGGAWTLNFPASASAGHKIHVVDLKGTFDTNSLTIGRNGLNIENQATDLVCDIKGFISTFYYVDATIGWKRI